MHPRNAIESELEYSKVQCPNCKTERAHRSHRRGIWERVSSLLGFYPYRCHQCHHRFLHYKYAMPKDAPSSTEREIRATRMKIKRKRKTREFMLYGFGLLLFLLFLYYITRPQL
jgi:hypothetical protein